MTTSTEYRVARGVRIALDSLPAEEQEQLTTLLSSRESFLQHASVSGNVQKLPGSGPPLFVMNVGPQIRLVYSDSPDGIEVRDLIEQGRIDFFRLQSERSQGGTPLGDTANHPGGLDSATPAASS
jgi:hypothetical protein